MGTTPTGNPMNTYSAYLGPWPSLANFRFALIYLQVLGRAFVLYTNSGCQSGSFISELITLMNRLL